MARERAPVCFVRWKLRSRLCRWRKVRLATVRIEPWATLANTAFLNSLNREALALAAPSTRVIWQLSVFTGAHSFGPSARGIRSYHIYLPRSIADYMYLNYQWRFICIDFYHVTVIMVNMRISSQEMRSLRKNYGLKLLLLQMNWRFLYCTCQWDTVLLIIIIIKSFLNYNYLIY